jgi:hypothetical protein
MRRRKKIFLDSMGVLVSGVGVLVGNGHEVTVLFLFTLGWL